MTTFPPNPVHDTFGPYYACRYVGEDPDVSQDPDDPDDPDDVDVVAWLLYAVPPTPDLRRLDGVLYNRRRGQEEHRDDRWIARVHGAGHHDWPPRELRNFGGRTEADAVRRLWWHLNGDQATDEGYAEAVEAMAQVTPGSGCVRQTPPGQP